MKRTFIINTFILFMLFPVISKAQTGDHWGLIIKQVYYTGSQKSDGTTYFSDQFIEIYNNTDRTIYTDGLMIGDVYGVSGQINPNSTPTPFQDSTDFVYLNNIWQIPGTGTTGSVLLRSFKCSFKNFRMGG